MMAGCAVCSCVTLPAWACLTLPCGPASLGLPSQLLVIVPAFIWRQLLKNNLIFKNMPPALSEV